MFHVRSPFPRSALGRFYRGSRAFRKAGATAGSTPAFTGLVEIAREGAAHGLEAHGRTFVERVLRRVVPGLVIETDDEEARYSRLVQGNMIVVDRRRRRRQGEDRGRNLAADPPELLHLRPRARQ